LAVADAAAPGSAGPGLDLDLALDRSSRVVALTGAGISAESGVPTFRGPGGLWREHRALASEAVPVLVRDLLARVGATT
jgi:NAD-dependent deacetylase